MKIKAISVLAICWLFLCACKKEGDSSPDPTEPETEQENDSASVETNPPNSSYTPAFRGQTRVAAVTTQRTVSSRVLTDQLTRPWGITSLPDGRFLITQKTGQMRIVTTTGQVSSTITGLPAVNSSGQGGLLGLCIDPQFASTRLVYWVFSEPVTGGVLTAVASGRLSEDETRIENATVIYRATPAHPGSAHFGGRILFDRSGYLLVSTGERSDMATRPQAQSLNSGLGKIVRISTTGEAAPDNPFVGQAGARPEIWSYGHRNPQGLAIHPVTGDLWQTEHGPRGGDELNQVTAGGNYGWPTITYGLEYSGQAIGGAIQQRDGLQQPVYYWDPVISPSGITFYQGNTIPEWQNNLFIASLSGTHVARLVIENNRVVGEQRLLAQERQRFRDITQGSDGALYAVTDEGRLYRISLN